MKVTDYDAGGVYDEIFEQFYDDNNVEYELFLEELRDNSYTGDIKSYLKNDISDIRNKLPNSLLSKRGNMAVAEVNFEGVYDKFYAHSKINNSFDTGADVVEFSLLKTENERIFNSYVDDIYPRYHDTEAKILEDIASQIENPDIKGEINLYSELPCCQSCSNLILEFRLRFPNIELNVFVQ